MSKLYLREGGIYRRRDGEVVGPAARKHTGLFPWEIHHYSHTEDGRYSLEFDHPYDIIEEVFLSETITDEEVVRRYWDLVREGRVEWKKDNCGWYQQIDTECEYRLVPPKPAPKTIRIFDREVTQEELKALKKALEEV